ncbi:MAG: hypothetical protein ACREYA_15280 [Cupriavidus necator]|uniref:hypothetical protein n=1 Tax=Cupriavidus necator TaxID=106590 RepID=UPI003DC5C15F
MQMSTHHPAGSRHIVPAGTIDSLEQISAGLSALLLLVEIESERSEGCHNVYSLLAMVKAQLDQTAAKLCADE